MSVKRPVPQGEEKAKIWRNLLMDWMFAVDILLSLSYYRRGILWKKVEL